MATRGPMQPKPCTVKNLTPVEDLPLLSDHCAPPVPKPRLIYILWLKGEESAC